MRERTTASRCSPSKVQASDQALHQFSVALIAYQGSIGRGGGLWDWYHVKVNGICCPALNEKSATVFISSPRVSARVHRASESGPAVAVSKQSWRETHGTICP